MAISDGDRHEAYLSRVQSPLFDRGEILAMLRRRATFIASVTLLCAGMSLTYILLATPKYIASGRILLDPPLSQMAGADAGSHGDAAIRVTQNQIDVMTSRGVLDKVVTREKLETDPLFGARSKGVLTAILAGIGLVPASDPNAMALRQLNRALSVTRSLDSSVVNVDVVTSDGETSARVANAVMESYVEEEARMRAEPARGTDTPADARKEMLQARVRETEQRYEAYRKESEAAVASGGPAGDNQASDLSGEIADAEAKVSGLRSALAEVQRASDERDFRAIPESLRNETLNSLKDRYLAASRAEADLLKTVGPRHADVRLARQQMAEITRMLDRAIKDVIQSTAAELERARFGVTRLKTLEASKDLQNPNEISARLKELEREVETSRAAYQAFLTQSPDLGEQRRLSGSHARILSRATAPLERSGVSPIRILLINVLLGLGFAVSLAWLLELIGQRNDRAELR